MKNNSEIVVHFRKLADEPKFKQFHAFSESSTNNVCHKIYGRPHLTKYARKVDMSIISLFKLHHSDAQGSFDSKQRENEQVTAKEKPFLTVYTR